MYACTKCMWCGEEPKNTDECPECGAEAEVSTDNTPLYEYFDAFNWNKP